MDIWNRIPAIKIAPVFILGIVLAQFFPSFLGSSLFLMLLPLCFLFVVVFVLKKVFHPFVYLLPFLMLVIPYTHLHTYYQNADHFSNKISNLQKEQTLLVRVDKQAVEKPNSFKIFVDVLGFVEGEKLVSSHGKVLVYLEKSTRAASLSYGNEILISGYLNEVEPPKNPDQFNYKTFLATDGIHYQLYAKTSHWELSNKRGGGKLLQSVFDLRRALRQKLKKAIPSEDDFAVASALILGDKSFLDTEILMSYSAAGAMHVLAVSGLHVGMIFLFLQAVFSWVKKTRYSWIYPILVLAFLWFYALLTGFSPSVQRAATMFSFVVIGQSLQKPTNIYNSLAASAIFLMILNPMIIYKVGFQLSYIAVIGIVYFHPKIFNLIYIKWWFLRKLWEISVISIAAQIATFPLTLYYFHQFPTYFMVSNLFVIPLAGIILALGFGFLFFSALGIYQPFEWLLNTSLAVMNKGIFWVDSLPYSLFYGQYLYKVELFALFAIILILMVYISWRLKRYLFYSLGALTLLLVFSAFIRYGHTQKKEFIVYHVPHHLAINYIGHNENVLWSDQAILDSDSEKLYYFKHHWFSVGYIDADNRRLNLNNSSEYLEGFQSKNVFHFLGKNILVLDQEHKMLKGKWDLVILSGNCFYDVKKWDKNKIKQLVIATSIPSYKANKLSSLAQKSGLEVWNIWEKGAFILD